MTDEKKHLKARYRKAIRKLERENDIIGRAIDRKSYWKTIVKNIEIRLELSSNGQLELGGINDTQ